MPRRTLAISLMIGYSLLKIGYSAPALPLSTAYWKDPAFLKSFNGSYRIEARIEPNVSTEERGLLVEVQELMKAGQRKQALAKLEGSSLTKKSPALTFNLGNLQFEEGEIDEAIKSYEDAIEDYPSFRRAHRNLAMALVRGEKLDEALPHLLEAIRLGDSGGATYGLLGYCRLQRGEWASALQAYRLAQLTEPEVAEWKAGTAQCLQQMEAREEAAALLGEVVAQRPGESGYALLLATVLIELGRQDEAVKALELPRRLGSLDPAGQMLLAELELRAGRVERAAEVVDAAFEVAEGKPTVQQVLPAASLGLAAREWDFTQGLIDHLDGADSTELSRLQGRLWIESGREPAKGVELLEGLVGKDPTDGMALLVLGKHAVSSGEPGKGELLLERATAVAEVAADAWVELVRLRVDQRRYEAALEALDRALEIRPGGELERYRESLQRLADAAR